MIAREVASYESVESMENGERALVSLLIASETVLRQRRQLARCVSMSCRSSGVILPST